MPDVPIPFVYHATRDRVIDGDTFVADVDLGFMVHVKLKVRIQGVNAPEHNTPEGPGATAYLTDQTEGPLLLASHKDQRSFERWVCDVWLADGTSLAEAIIASGHGVPMTRLLEELEEIA